MVDVFKVNIIVKRVMSLDVVVVCLLLAIHSLH